MPCLPAFSTPVFHTDKKEILTYLTLVEIIHFQDSVPDSSIGKKENPRVVAALLCATLGLLGVHRMYLGTDAKVPVFYTLTIGGGVVLWFADLAAILFSKNLDAFMNNPAIFMWKKKE